MSLKTISREEITLLKNKRKKKIKRIIISVSSIVVLCCIGVGVYFSIDYYNENTKGKEIKRPITEPMISTTRFNIRFQT